jgi:ATP-binding cassette subfamily B protein/subfamily B ATP-binding cassette protein MsbA
MNFVRVLRLALRNRWTFAASFLSAMAVAVLWGGNMGAVYPFVEVGLLNQKPRDLIDKRIEQSEQIIAQKTAEVQGLRDKLPQVGQKEQAGIQADIRLAEDRIWAEGWARSACLFVKSYVNDLLPESPFHMFVLVMGLLLLGTLVKDVFLVANNVFVARLAQKAAFDLRKLFYRRTLRMDLATFSEEGTADLMSRFTNDMNKVAAGVEALFGKMVREPAKMVVCLVLAAMISWQLLLLSLVIAPLAGCVIGWLAKTLKRTNRRAMEEMSAVYTTLEETFRSIKIVKAFTNERQERKRFHDNSKSYYNKAMWIAAYDSLSHPLTEILGVTAITIAMLAGVWLVLSGETHLFGIRMTHLPLRWGTLGLFYALLAAAADPARKLSDIFSSLQGASAAADRIFSQLDRQPKIREPRNPVPFHGHCHDLTFENVSFGYQPNKLVLQDVNLQIAFGETIAIVGPNGCGKSTLANLIPRFADPTVGTVKIDGVPLTNMRTRDVRRQIGLVTQETMLFNDTIFNNIRYGCPNATREQVVQAAKQAHAHRFIEHDLPHGYETSAGALGNSLSGGQRQRIALARAILRDPPILILDEATSQVDLESEQAIQQVLETFVRGRTTVIITHRLAILSLADRVVVMDDGRVLDVGCHEELLGRCGLYRRFNQIHFDDLRQTA